MKGWNIAVTGMATPSEGTRTIYVYAYCAAGIQQPQRVDATIWTTNVGDAFIVDARCPPETLAVGGGFSAGSYTYDGGAKTAYVPVYRSILRNYGWQVASDGFSRSQPSFGATFDPYPSARLDATAICASTRDFTRIAWQNGPELPFSTATQLNVTQKLQMTSYEIGNAYVTAYITYFGQYTQPSACPAGAFLLPPSYALSLPTGQDVRIDEVWVSPSLNSWTVAVSTGGATNYPTNSAPILYPYETCLVPK
jgi:hypothetical protein